MKQPRSPMSCHGSAQALHTTCPDCKARRFDAGPGRESCGATSRRGLEGRGINPAMKFGARRRVPASERVSSTGIPQPGAGRAPVVRPPKRRWAGGAAVAPGSWAIARHTLRPLPSTHTQADILKTARHLESATSPALARFDTECRKSDTLTFENKVRLGELRRLRLPIETATLATTDDEPWMKTRNIQAERCAAAGSS